MKIIFSLILLMALASPLVAQEPTTSDQVLGAAFTALQYGTGPEVAVPGDIVGDRSMFVVSDATIGGAERSLREFLDSSYGQVIADEIFASYHSNSSAVQRLGTRDIACLQIRPLDDFAAGSDAYSWTSLHDKFPQVHTVIRVSRPALDKTGAIAVVRYECIREPQPFSKTAAFCEFVKDPDGSWRQTRAVIGSLWD